eukprot:4287502-Amphidinium_carterae.1
MASADFQFCGRSPIEVSQASQEYTAANSGSPSSKLDVCSLVAPMNCPKFPLPPPCCLSNGA